MARRRRPGQVPKLLEQLAEEMRDFSELHDELAFREKVILLGEMRHLVHDLGVSLAVAEGAGPGSGKERVHWYLKQFLGEIVAYEELAVVSGIPSFRRRTGELRVEEGHQVYTGAKKPADLPFELKRDEYILTKGDVDAEAAELWRIKNEIRRMDCGFKSKALKLLQERFGKIVTTGDFRYVAVDRYEPRRIRELRTQDGYAYATQNRGYPRLKVGEYMLLAMEPILDSRTRNIDKDVQRAVYKRDRHGCRCCGWTAAEWNPADSRIFELHHLQPHEDGGENNEENLVLLCQVCHDRVHAGKLDMPRSMDVFNARYPLSPDPGKK